MYINSSGNLHFNKREVRSNMLQPPHEDENLDRDQHFVPHTVGGGVVGKQRAQPQEHRGLCLRAPLPVWPRLGAGNIQREETKEYVLGICTLCFYISKTQISTTLHSYHDEKHVNAGHDLCSNGFCIISMQHGLDSPTLTLFTTMF